MKSKTILIFFLFLAIQKSYSQSGEISGKIKDTLNKISLANATISLVRVSDSLLVKFIRTNADGSFKLSNIIAGKYFLMISNHTYADYVDKIIVDEKPLLLGIIPLITKAKLLEEVVVKQKIAAIRIKGDTTEYKADSFKVAANASVQDLLKKLPGITVNSRGEITAQGQTVKKVLVDGEEFFSDDPAVVTQGLRADAIDKVQVFDKKSDQATFTGIDDGEKNKTINLQMKEDKKKGYFGKVEVGSDFDKYRSSKVLANIFKAKKKLAAYITNDNTRFDGLDWEERKNYSEDLSSSMEMNEDGGMMFWSNGDDFSWGEGFPTNTTAGLHYSQKWKEDKHNISNTYQYNNLGVIGETVTNTKTLLNDSAYTTGYEKKLFDNTRNRNRLRTSYEWTIDSNSSLKTLITGSIINSKGNSNYLGNSADLTNNLINETERSLSSNERDQTFIGNILWRKKFRKKGRTVLINADFNFNNKNNKGFLFSKNTFYKPGFTQIELIDQYKINDEDKFSVVSKIVYTEPLWKNVFLELNYKFENNKNNAERITFAKNGLSSEYADFIDSLSNHFIFNNAANTAGFNVKYQGKKINFSVGSGIGAINYHLDDIEKLSNRTLHFTNYLPIATIGFTPKKQTRLNLSYNGKTKNPSLNQIQPIVDNTNTLNITTGNPNLQQEFSHNIGLNFSKYQVLKSKSIYLSANLNVTNNAIVSQNIYDKTTGKNINQYVNVNGNYMFYMWSHYSFELFESFNLNFGFSPNASRHINFVNGIKNINDNNSYRFSIGTGYWGDKWLNYNIDFSANYISSKSTINPIETKYWEYNPRGSVEMKFKKIKCYFELESNATIYQKSNSFANATNEFITNLTFKKSLDKAENWQLKLYFNDLFNTNVDINRNTTSNFISQTTNQAIKRFALFSIIYNFSKK
jgi:hypothetical protein